ncbi:dihydroorotase [candidate division KSB1 bacterium]|nr:dihydroorotase [candidate division KSB1 bacterium]
MGSTDSIKRIDKILFTNARVIEAEKLSEQKQDVVIEDGKLKEIGKISSAGFSGKVVDLHGLALCPGLIDMHVHLREPGGEHKETIETGCDSAMAGGFTGVCPMPNTTPAADNPKIIEFLKNQSKDLLVDVFPIAAVTKDRAGAVLTEMEALVQAGAVAFSDDGDPVATAGILRSAMQNAKKLDVPIIEHCEDKSFSGNWAMNEGVVSMRLGLPGIPGIAEEVMVARDIQVAECTGAKIHIAHISTAKAVDLVRQAKKQGVQVTCEVMPHHFSLTEEAVSKQDTNAKMSPPLRTQQDVDAMLIGLQDGTIDVIATDHAPHAKEEKEVEFIKAPMGIVGLETALGLVLSNLVGPGLLTLSQAICKMTKRPAEILNLERGELKIGAPASLTIFAPEHEWTVDKTQFKSKSQNTPFEGWKLKGKVFGLYNKNMWWQA